MTDIEQETRPLLIPIALIVAAGALNGLNRPPDTPIDGMGLGLKTALDSAVVYMCLRLNLAAMRPSWTVALWAHGFDLAAIANNLALSL